MGNYADTYAATTTTGHLHKLRPNVHQLEPSPIWLWHRAEWRNLPAFCHPSIQRVRPKTQINHSLARQDRKDVLFKKRGYNNYKIYLVFVYFVFLIHEIDHW